ncbi:MAG TPA: hypothetical protein VFH44_10160 [Solirubrobacterales bacterium]|nr:hypothetical protein [Solirubrobacterales bacterium]
MLFELGGKRKRVIQVIYVCLAVLMFVALVGFGIGGNVSGGIFDAVGLGGGDSASDPRYDAQIERAEQTLQTDPKDEKALLTLARTHFLAGQAATETDEQGRVTLTDETLGRYEEATAAWERYLATKPKEPDDGVASLMVQSYSATASADPTQLEAAVDGAFRAAQVVAEARPSAGTNLQLATYAYLAGEDEVAKQAEQAALKDAVDSTTRNQIKTQLAQAKQQGEAIARAIKQSAPDQGQLENPLGDLGGTSPVPGG